MNKLSYEISSPNGERGVMLIIDDKRLDLYFPDKEFCPVPLRFFEDGLPYLPPNKEYVKDFSKKIVLVCSCGEYGCDHINCKLQIKDGLVVLNEFTRPRYHEDEKFDIEFQFTIDNYNEVITEILNIRGNDISDNHSFKNSSSLNQSDIEILRKRAMLNRYLNAIRREFSFAFRYKNLRTSRYNYLATIITSIFIMLLYILVFQYMEFLAINRELKEIIVSFFAASFMTYYYSIFLFMIVRRLHDLNRSGWLFFIPWISIIIIPFKGTEGGNWYDTQFYENAYIRFDIETGELLPADHHLSNNAEKYPSSMQIAGLLVMFVTFFLLMLLT